MRLVSNVFAQLAIVPAIGAMNCDSTNWRRPSRRWLDATAVRPAWSSSLAVYLDAGRIGLAASPLAPFIRCCCGPRSVRLRGRRPVTPGDLLLTVGALVGEGIINAVRRRTASPWSQIFMMRPRALLCVGAD